MSKSKSRAKDFADTLEAASREVATWPTWKQSDKAKAWQQRIDEQRRQWEASQNPEPQAHPNPPEKTVNERLDDLERTCALILSHVRRLCDFYGLDEEPYECPFQAWAERQPPGFFEQYEGCWMAVDADKGVVVAEKDGDLFTKKLREVPEKEQESLLLTHGDHYLDGKV
jgi:hypothetical protein